MCFPKLTLAFVLIASTAAGQEPNPQAMQMQVQKIAQERPREAEAAARAFVMLVGIVGTSRHEALDSLLGSLDSLKANALDAYWQEVGQLAVHYDIVQNLNRRDSVRATLATQMFATEMRARLFQRAYRHAAEARRQAIRAQLESLIGQHFDLEDRLRALEVADIERRLADVRAETQRRRDKRAELVKWAVDDIIRDATRPQ